MKVWANVKKVTLGGMFVGAMMLASSLTVTGCLTDDKKDSTTTPTDTAHHTALGTEATLSAGGQGHPTLGSVLELDAGKVLLSAAANADQGNIDLVLLYFSGAWHLDNAVQARADGIANSINLTNTYTLSSLKDLKIVKLTAKPSDQEDAKAKFTAGSATAVKGLVITGGEYLVMETTGGKIAVVYVKSVTGTDNKGAGDFTFSLLTI